MRKIIEKYAELPESLFKRIYFTFLFGFIPYALLQIIICLYGGSGVDFNHKNVSGVNGALVVLFLYIPMFPLMLAFFTWLYFLLGNFIIRMIKKIFYE